MPLAGAKPKTDRTQIRHRVPPVHEWTEVEDVPFAGAPPLRNRETQLSYADAGVVPGSGWPQSTQDWWDDVSTMPHCKLWTTGDWRFAMDTAEVHARTMEAWRGYTGAELRQREKLLGLYADALRDLRIRYVKPQSVDEQATPAGVANLADYRGL